MAEKFSVIKTKWPYWLPGAFGLLGIVLIIVATSRYGAGLYSDSITYLSAANNISTGNGYYNHLGEPVLVFPPFYAMALAVFSPLPVELNVVARYLNAVFFGLIVSLASYWLVVNTRSLSLSLIGSVAILASRPLVETSVFALSDLLFILLSLVALFQMTRLTTSASYQPLLVAGLLVSMACLTRYAGVALVITGCALLSLGPHPYGISQRAKRLVVFIIVALTPLSLWLVRNYSLSGSLTGDRVDSTRSWTTNVGLGADVMTNWLLPYRVPVTIRIALVGLFLIGLTLKIIFATRRYRYAFSRIIDEPLFPLLLFIPVYLVFLLVSVSTTALSPIDNRYLAPIFVPGILIIVIVLNDSKRNTSFLFGKPTVPTALLFGLALWLIYPLAGTTNLMRWYLANGAGGFHSERWVESELIEYLNDETLPGVVFTNEVEAVYAFTGKIFMGSPSKYKYESLTPTDDLHKFDQSLNRHGSVYLVMFEGDWWREYLYDVEFFKSRYALEEVIMKRDGVIYRVRHKAP